MTLSLSFLFLSLFEAAFHWMLFFLFRTIEPCIFYSSTERMKTWSIQNTRFCVSFLYDQSHTAFFPLYHQISVIWKEMAHTMFSVPNWWDGVMGSEGGPNIRHTWHRILFPHVSENVNRSGSSCFYLCGHPCWYSPFSSTFSHIRVSSTLLILGLLIFSPLKKEEYANISRHYVIAENAWEST